MIIGQNDRLILGVPKMIIELALIVAVIAATGATIVKLYEWRQDVLYGPYLAPEHRATSREKSEQ